MDRLNFVIPVQQLAGFKIRRGAGGIGWCCMSGGATTYESAAASLERAILDHVSGRSANGSDLRCCHLR